jgi:hypothetical protein
MGPCGRKHGTVRKEGRVRKERRFFVFFLNSDAVSITNDRRKEGREEGRKEGREGGRKEGGEVVKVEKVTKEGRKEGRKGHSSFQ